MSASALDILQMHFFLSLQTFAFSILEEVKRTCWKLSELFWCVYGDVQRGISCALKYICNALGLRHRERRYEADVTVTLRHFYW
jgi:hypothetical protein